MFSVGKGTGISLNIQGFKYSVLHLQNITLICTNHYLHWIPLQRK